MIVFGETLDKSTHKQDGVSVQSTISSPAELHFETVQAQSARRKTLPLFLQPNLS
jgi:hypothetical protein